MRIHRFHTLLLAIGAGIAIVACQEVIEAPPEAVPVPELRVPDSDTAEAAMVAAFRHEISKVSDRTYFLLIEDDDPPVHVMEQVAHFHARAHPYSERKDREGIVLKVRSIVTNGAKVFLDMDRLSGGLSSCGWTFTLELHEGTWRVTEEGLRWMS